jgi:amidase
MADNLDLLIATTDTLVQLLQSGAIDSKRLVNGCLSQIEKHDNYLHAMIAVAPKKLLLEQADILDQERAVGKSRSRIHGIPIIVKVRIHSHWNMMRPKTECAT